MMTLHENKALFKELTLKVAEKMKVKPQMIEKDYWVTYAVKTLFSSKISDKIVFKGGTSLSKCYRAISRFSEDIDICLANYEDDSRAFRRRTMKRITKVLSSVLPQIEMPDTRKEEIIRTTCHTYNHVFPSVQLGQVKEHIKLEVTQMGNYAPFQKHTMRSYIGDHLDELGDYATIEAYHLEAFSVRVLGLERTLAEKISCLVQYSHTFDPYKALGDRIRHIFDLHELLQRKEIKAYLQRPSFGEMLTKVKEEERKNYPDNNLWLTAHPCNALLFAKPLDTLRKIPSLSREGFGVMLVNRAMPANQSLVDSLSQIHKALKKVRWHTLEEKEAGWVDRVYRTMKVYLPYDGVYNSIIVAKDLAEITDKKRASRLYISPLDSKERRLSQLMELAKRDQLPMEVTDGYAKAYPAQFDLLKGLAKEYGVKLKEGFSNG